MKVTFGLARRNTLVFLRDRTAVFFSLLSVFIIIGLYALFLGDTNVKSIQNMVGQSAEGIRWLIDSWIMAGILVVNSVTVTLGVFGVMVEDETRKRLMGFLVAPVSRSKIVTAYLIASWIVGFALCMLTVVLAEIYIVLSGGELLPLHSLLKVTGLNIINVFSSSCAVFLLITFVRTNTGFATLSTVLGTIIGFITGIYIPIGALPEAVQTAVKFVPASYSTSLMRKVFMEEPAKAVFQGAPQQAVDTFYNIFGVKISVGGAEITNGIMVAIVVLSGVLFLLMSILKLKERKIGK